MPGLGSINILGDSDSATNIMSSSKSPAAPQLEAAPVKMRAIGDTDATRKAIDDNVFNTASSLPEVSNKTHTLRLSNVKWADGDKFSKRERKDALLKGHTLGRRLRGTWQLVDNASGNVVDERHQTLFKLPHLSESGTFIHNGNEYALRNQERLDPGIYTRIKDNGEFESHVNVLKGGPSHRIQLDAAKGVFKLHVGQANIPLLPLLQHLGATEHEIREAWGNDARGNDLYGRNYSASDGSATDRIIEKFMHGKVPEGVLPHEAIRQAFEKMQMSPEVNRHTLGQPHDILNKHAYLDATKKLLAVSRNEAAPDDRDHLAYQTFLGPEDLFKERLAKDRAGVRRQLLFKASMKGNLQALPSSPLQHQIDSALLDSGLGNVLEEINPAEILDKNTQVSRMGEGGIPSYDAIPKEARSVQPSHFGFIDPLRTPESAKAGVDVFLSTNVRKGDNGKLYGRFVDPRTGKPAWKSPQEVADTVVTFPGAMNLPGKRIPAIKNGRITYAKKGEIGLVLPAMEHAFSPLGNMVPLKSMVKGQRMVMASRMLTQALPLVNGEAPLVQSGVPGSNGTKSYEEEYGKHMGAVHAEQGGRVIAATPDVMTVKYDDGKIKTVDLYNNQPFNRKSVTGSTQILVYKTRTDDRQTGPWVFDTAIADYVYEPGDRVLSIDPTTKRSAWMPITGYLKHKNDKQLFRVSTVSGREVVVTEDHSLMTMGDDAKLSPVFPIDCVVGKTRLPLAMIPERGNASEPNDNLDLGRIAGLYLAEGHCPPSQPNLIIIAVKPDARAAEVMSLLARVSKGKPFRNGGTVCVTDAELSKELVSRFGHLSHKKRLPASYVNWSRSFREGLIQGYMSGDGCLHEDLNGAIQVEATTVSEKLRSGLVAILSSLGVFATLAPARRAHLSQNWRDGFKFRVVSSDLAKLSRWFFYEDRQLYFEELRAEKYRASLFTGVPIPRAARKLLYSEFVGKVPSHIHKCARSGYVHKHRLTACVGDFGTWGRSDVLWDIVKSIEPVPTEEWVYDLSVESAEAFAVCHGLVVHNTFIHQTPVVQPGQRFSAGQPLIKSNFTDHRGATALGANARVAYMPWGGKNFEDATVISESMAKRFTSEHAYQHQLEVNDRTRMGRNAFISLFPSKYDKTILANLDEHGRIKPGTKVNYGDPLILGAEERELAHNKIHRKGASAFNDVSVTWGHHDPGVVTDVVNGKNGPVVVVKSTHPMQVGDKMSGRYGDKGVVADIVPDAQMPHGSDGKPFEVLLNDLGTISRTNPAQWAEAKLGQIAEKTGQPVKVEDFDDKIPDRVAWIKNLMLQHGLKDQEDVTDPVRGTKIPGVYTGKRFFMKLHHTAESKNQGRGSGAYTAQNEPAKGGESGAKRISLLDANALLSHGATEVLRDSSAIRGQRNDDWWLQFMQGHTPRDPKVPMVYDKFLGDLKASGINVVRDGSQLHIMALTNKDVDHLAGDRNIEHGDTVKFHDGLKPVDGGLFDTKMTGGHHGNRWSAIKLSEPMPNPVMEEPIRRVLGLTQKKFQDVLAGKAEVGTSGGGPTGIANALSKINVDRELLLARNKIRFGTKSDRDDAVRKLGYLKSAKRLGIHPGEWMLNRAPVLPPQFRPVNTLGNKNIPLVADPNFLYKELIESNKNLADMKGKVGDDVGDERLAVYNAFKAVTGLGDPITQASKDKQVRGILKSVFGNSPKFGTVQRKLISSTVDNVGRGVVAPDPDLDMDSIGLPEDRAFDVYERFVARRLHRSGMPLTGALQEIRNRTPLARKMLVDEMGQRPVIVNRAPVLHRFGIMAFQPRLVKGSVLQVSPLIVKGFNMDFDGDAVQYHVPASEEARVETLARMLPSRQLLSPADFRTPVHVPGQEYVGGLWKATTHRTKRTHTFRNLADAKAAWKHGEIGIGDAVKLLSEKDK